MKTNRFIKYTYVTNLILLCSSVGFGNYTNGETSYTKNINEENNSKKRFEKNNIKNTNNYGFLKKFYGNFESHYRAEDTLANEPGSTSMAGDSKYRLLLNLSLGYGAIKLNNFLFNLHYQYSQNWETDFNQVTIFKERWFSKPKMENFLFPTQSLLRTHSLALDSRYVYNNLQFGLFSRINIARIGSKLIGDKLETSETAAISEQFVPYFGVKIDRYYRGEFSSPFKTEINKQDPRLSNSTYSWSPKGRGRVFSYQLRNAAYVPNIASIFYLDLFYLQYRFASLFEDKTKTGMFFSVDYPLWLKLRTKPKVHYFKENYIVERTRIPGFQKGSSLENNNPAELKKRTDSQIILELSIDYSISDRMRVEVFISKGEKKSTITEYNTSTTFFGMSYVYALPSVTISQRKVQRFQDNNFTSEF